MLTPRPKMNKHERQAKKNAYNRTYHAENKERLNENKKQYRRDNKERITAVQKQYYEDNRAAYINRAGLRKRKVAAINELLPGEWEAMVEECGNVCIVPGCENMPVTQDHVVPLSKGGRHHIVNLQPICLPCNVAKGTDTADYRIGVPDGL